MNTVLAARVALLVVGLAVWAYGVRFEDSRMRLIGIGVLAASLVLRFFARRRRDGDQTEG